MRNNRSNPYVDNLEFGWGDGYPEETRPHAALWSAVLYRGIQDYCWFRKEASGEAARGKTSRVVGHTTYNHTDLRDEVETWFWEEPTTKRSFAWICEMLGLDAPRLRSAVLSQWRKYARAPQPETSEAAAASSKPRKGANGYTDGPTLRL